MNTPRRQLVILCTVTALWFSGCADNAEVTRLEARIAALEARPIPDSNRVAELERQVEEERSAIQRLEKHRAELARLRVEVDNLFDGLKAAKDGCADLARELNNTARELRTVKSQWSDRRAQGYDLASELSSVALRLGMLERTVANVERDQRQRRGY
jgi:chromosome segregation ATPase